MKVRNCQTLAVLGIVEVWVALNIYSGLAVTHLCQLITHKYAIPGSLTRSLISTANCMCVCGRVNRVNRSSPEFLSKVFY